MPEALFKNNRYLTGRRGWFFALTALLLPLVFYWLTAFRTVTWWGNGEYAAAAVTLGIPHPPGSLLLTVLGWLVTLIPSGAAPILELNFFAGALAALTVGFLSQSVKVLYTTTHSFKDHHRQPPPLVFLFGAVLGVWIFAFSETLWLYAVHFSPYMLTVLMTSLIFIGLLRWWQSADSSTGLKWLFVISLLFGLDFSVHRTNFVLLPALLVWVLLRRPRAVISIKSWLHGLSGFILGLGVHLLIIPLSMRQPAMNATNPSSLAAFWDYVSLKQQGGGFLLKLVPRNAGLWDVQVMDFVDAFAANFFDLHTSFGILGAIPVLLSVTGVVMILKRNRRMGIALILMLFVTSAATVIYFNIPANFFRSLDRHYLPCLFMAAVWIAFGAGSVLQAARNCSGRWKYLLVSLVLVLLLAMPMHQLLRNYSEVDGSRQYYTHDYVHNIFKTLPPNAILFTSGDNDTFPLWYLQMGENVRTDVTVLNQPLLNTSWFLEEIFHKQPDFPLGILRSAIVNLDVRSWQDTTIAIPVVKDPQLHHLPDNVRVPDTLYMRVPPTVHNEYLMVQDWVVLSIIRSNAWRRPIYFTYQPQWLQPYLQSEGAASRLVPIENGPPNRDILYDNLMTKYEYRGFADPDVPLPPSSRFIGWNLYQSFVTLAMIEQQQGDTKACAAIKETMLDRLPLDRLQPQEQFREFIVRLCESNAQRNTN